MTKKEKMYKQINNHGTDLNRIFKTGIDNIALCKKLRRLEVKAHRLATDYCNGENNVNTDNWDNLCEPILKAVDKIINYSKAGYAVHVNGDARGYALKIDFEGSIAPKYNGIYQDMGGHGILAPEFNGE